MRDFTTKPEDINHKAIKQDSEINGEQLDVLRVVYYVYIQYKKYKSALRVLSVLLNFDKNDELALLATVYCYFCMKRFRKAESLLKTIEPKLKSDKAKDMFDYLNALTMTEIGQRESARKVYLKVKNTNGRYSNYKPG